MQRILIAVMLLAGALSPFRAGCEGLPLPADHILEKSDAVLVAPGGSYLMKLEVRVPGGRTLAYELRNHVKDYRAQRAIFLAPAFDREDSAIRKGDTAYFKYRAWPKYDAMSAKSAFLDSPFTWEDALYPGLAGAYEVASVAWDELAGERLWRCELRPLADGGYRRIDVWLRPANLQTVRRVYYTPSGKPWKTGTFGSYAMAGGHATAWELTMTNDLTKSAATMSVGERRSERMPDSFFEPASPGKER